MFRITTVKERWNYGALIRSLCLILLDTSMLILLAYTGRMLTPQTYFWLLHLAITGPVFTLIPWFLFQTDDVKSWKKNLEFTLKTGIINGILGWLNLVCVGYATPTQRTPGPFQAIFSQVTMPATVLFSWLLIGKNLNWKCWSAAGLVFIGIVLTLVPTFTVWSSGP